MNESPTPDLPSWDELDLPVLDEVVDESAVPVLEDEVLDVPDFDFSSELDVMQHELGAAPAAPVELDIPELTLEDLEVAAPELRSAPLDLTALPSLDLSEVLAHELSLEQVLPDLAVAMPASAPQLPPQAEPSRQPEAPLMAVDGFDFVLDAHDAVAAEHAVEAVTAIVPEPAPAMGGDEAAIVIPELETLAVPGLESLSPQQIENEVADIWQSAATDTTGSLAETAAPAAVDATPSLAAPPALPGGLSISLDSLPAGVLGGGIGRPEEEIPSAAELLAKAQALVSTTPTSLDEVLLAAEQTLAHEEHLQRFDAGASGPEKKSFASLSDEELQAAMSDLPTLQPLDEEGEDWPSLGEVDRLNETELDEADIQAVEPMLQAEWQDELPAHALPELTAPVTLTQEEGWPVPSEVDSEAEQDNVPGRAMVPPVIHGMEGLFGESPFASERVPHVAAESAGIPELTEQLVDEPEGLPDTQTASTTEQLPEAVPLASPAVPAIEQCSEQDIPLPPLAELAGASFAAAMPVASPTEPEAHKAVEVLNVSAVATAAAAAALMHPAQRKDETVAVVDERALVDAMYEKLLPRMKVELSLWLQDALELQAKNMLSGVMQQLKEDYDMLFGETLKESLRQAILALGREQQGQHEPPHGGKD
ncbi:MAG: hypothetical protein JO338_03315 [Aquitalea sp.]|nr:hypothetical protein [Aquitalea sp.]